MNARAVAGAVFSLFLAISMACGGHHRSSAPEPTSEPAPEDVILQVDNHNWADVLLYVVHDGSTTRFLQVTATKSASVAIPSRLVGSNGMVRFIAHRIGGQDDYYSPAVSVRTGQTIALTLEGQLKMSSIGVW